MKTSPVFEIIEAARKTPSSTEIGTGEEYVRYIGDILQNLAKTLDHLRKCVRTHDKALLEQAQKEYSSGLKTSLPLAEKIIKKPDKTALDRRFVECIPILQKIGIALDALVNSVSVKVRSETGFSERALTEVSDIMQLTANLATDTRDVVLTGNRDFQRYVSDKAKKIWEAVEEYDLGHQHRLLIGTCSPKASFLYLDMTRSLRRIAGELATLSEKR